MKTIVLDTYLWHLPPSESVIKYFYNSAIPLFQFSVPIYLWICLCSYFFIMNFYSKIFVVWNIISIFYIFIYVFSTDWNIPFDLIFIKISQLFFFLPGRSLLKIILSSYFRFPTVIETIWSQYLENRNNNKT